MPIPSNVAVKLLTAYTLVVTACTAFALCGNCQEYSPEPEGASCGCKHCGMQWKFVAASFVPPEGREYLAQMMKQRFAPLVFIGVTRVEMLDRHNELLLAVPYYPDGWCKQAVSLPN